MMLALHQQHYESSVEISYSKTEAGATMIDGVDWNLNLDQTWLKKVEEELLLLLLLLLAKK